MLANITYWGGTLKHNIKLYIAGAVAGMMNGLFGAGGGMVLVPMLSNSRELTEDQVFPTSVSIIFPICIVSLLFSDNNLPIMDALPYLIGGAIGGLIAGITGNRIQVTWLHRGLGILIIWGGIRYLC